MSIGHDFDLKRIERERLGCALTYEDLAEKRGLNRKTVADCLCGRRRPQLATVQTLASVLGLRLRDVLIFEDKAA